MKAILYIGATLMAGASIYGFIDYKKSSHDKNFRNLYENKEQPTNPDERKVLNPAQEAILKNEPIEDVKTKEESKKKKKRIRAEEFSRAALDEKYLKEEVKTVPKKQPIKKEEQKQ